MGFFNFIYSNYKFFIARVFLYVKKYLFLQCTFYMYIRLTKNSISFYTAVLLEILSKFQILYIWFFNFFLKRMNNILTVSVFI